MGLLPSNIPKILDQENAEYSLRVLNFFNIIKSSSRRTFVIASLNLIWLVLRTIPRYVVKNIIDPFIGESVELVLEKLMNTYTVIFNVKHINPLYQSMPLNFPKNCRYIMPYKVIFGRFYPHYLIPIYCMSESALNVLFKNNMSTFLY